VKTSTAAAPAVKRRGRPAAVFYSPAEVGEILGFEDEAPVLRLLGHAKARLSFFPNAFQMGADATNWHIPEKDLRSLMGGSPVEPLLRVSTFAEVFDRDADTVRAWLSSGKLRSFVIEGQHHIPVSEYWRLRGQEPPRRARFSFFSERVSHSKGDGE
jgi:hypothetical protein